jgi:integrase/recombinase XerD
MATLKYISSRRRWQVRWHITCWDGKVLKGSKCFKDKLNAKDYRDSVERNAERWKAGITAVAESVLSAKDKWLDYNKRHTERTQGHYRMVIERFFATLDADNVQDITTGNIQDYIGSIIEGNSNRTANAHLTVIKSFCRWLSDQYDIPNVSEKVKMLTEDPPEQRFLSNDEYEAVLKVVDGVQFDAIVFLTHTGLRASEFCSLRWSNISQDRKSLTITGKGRKRRTIPLNTKCLEILDKYPVTQKHIIFSKNISRKYLYNLCADAAKSAGIPAFGPHALRHLFATELLVKGVPPAHVSKLLGHSSVKTTERIYIHFLPDHLAGITEVLI